MSTGRALLAAGVLLSMVAASDALPVTGLIEHAAHVAERAATTGPSPQAVLLPRLVPFADRMPVSLAEVVAAIPLEDSPVGTQDGPCGPFRFDWAKMLAWEGKSSPQLLVTVHCDPYEPAEVIRFYGVAGEAFQPAAEFGVVWGSFHPVKAFRHQGGRFILVTAENLGYQAGYSCRVLCWLGTQVRQVPVDNPVSKSDSLLGDGEFADADRFLIEVDGQGDDAGRLRFSFPVWKRTEDGNVAAGSVVGTLRLEKDKSGRPMRFAVAKAERKAAE